MQFGVYGLLICSLAFMVYWYAVRCLWLDGMQLGVYGLLVCSLCLWLDGIYLVFMVCWYPFGVYGLLVYIFLFMVCSQTFCFSRHAGIPLMFMVY